MIKEFVQPKMSLNSREFLIWKEGEREGVRERQGQLARSAGGIFKVRLGLGEIEGRDRDTER